jgi:hypothetical protein
VPAGAAFGILAAVLVLGLVAVFAFARTSDSAGGPVSFAQGGASPSVGLPGAGDGAGPAPDASGLASAPAGTATGPAGAATGAAPTGDGGSTAGAGDGGPGGAGSTDGGGGGATSLTGPAFYVGECVDTSGSGSAFNVVQSSCSNADYKIIYAFQNESGNVRDDQSQCYTVNGTDDEFENGGPDTGYTLYCMNSLTGDYSPRRANVDNCLDSSGEYEVDCTSSQAAWIVIGRLTGTTNTKGCTKFGSYDYSYYWSEPPPFVLCVDKYH